MNQYAQSDSKRWESMCQSVEMPKAGDELLDRILRERQAKERRTKRVRHYALVASIVLLLPTLAGIKLMLERDNDIVTLQRFAALNKPQDVNFIVNAKQAHAEVTFSVTVPPQWEFFGYRHQRALTWRGQLRAGKNLLSIPLVAHQAVAGTLVVSIRDKDTVKEYRIRVDVKSDQA